MNASNKTQQTEQARKLAKLESLDAREVEAVDNKMRLEIEDRSKRDPKFSMGGFFIVWETVVYPFPMKLYRGKFLTKKEAKAFVKRGCK